MTPCNPNTILSEAIVCADFCGNYPQKPEAEYVINFDSSTGTTLSANLNLFYDGSTNHYFRWFVTAIDNFDNEYIVYDFGFGEPVWGIPEMTNGSTFADFILGINNIDIKTFLLSLSQIIITNNVTLAMNLQTKDSFEQVSKTTKKYYFNI